MRKFQGNYAALAIVISKLITRPGRQRPSEASRGEIARAMFYMENRYHDAGLEIFSGQARMLRQWHRDDPPGAAEIERNDRIEGLQGNRNPYIDTPALLYDDN